MSDGPQILVVDDTDDVRRAYAQGMRTLGYAVSEASNGHEALERVRAEEFDAVVLDLHMPGMDGIETLRTLKQERKEVEVLMVTGYATIPSAVEAIRLGAYDYIAKPFSFSELDQRLKRCLQARELRWENMHLRGLLRDRYHYENLVGQSEPMQRLFRMIRQVAQTNSTVLLQGRSGTGKELVARAIHFNSAVAAAPMITVDCGAITPTVIESELFGHVKGAFTGAVSAKEGLFRLARGGTLFFDEIGELPLEMQTRLLRAIQQREIRPVGSDRTYPVDVRLIAATHKDLQKEVKEGRFREDLWYRINVISVTVPALCEHKEDLPLLINHFLRKHGTGKRPIERVAGDALQALLAYDWPGNVRELENVVERALALGQGPVILAADLTPQIAALAGRVSAPSQNASRESVPDAHPAQPSEAARDMLVGGEAAEEAALQSPLAPPASTDLSSLLAEAALRGENSLDFLEQQAILATLRVTGGDRAACAKILGIDKSTLYRKLKRYQFAVPSSEQEAGSAT